MVKFKPETVQRWTSKYGSFLKFRQSPVSPGDHYFSVNESKRFDLVLLNSRPVFNTISGRWWAISYNTRGISPQDSGTSSLHVLHFKTIKKWGWQAMNEGCGIFFETNLETVTRLKPENLSRHNILIHYHTSWALYSVHCEVERRYSVGFQPCLACNKSPFIQITYQTDTNPTQHWGETQRAAVAQGGNCTKNPLDTLWSLDRVGTP